MAGSKRIDNTLWVERYRPKSLDDYVGPAVLKSKVQEYLEDNDIPHLLFYGRAGVGKTTLAKIIVDSIDCDYLYVNASDENSVDTVRNKIKSFASSVGFRDLKVVILDEADFITRQGQAALRNLMEVHSDHTRFILTCNYHEQIIDPIQSRCTVFELAPMSRKEVAIHLSTILKREGISFDPKAVALIVNQSYPDIRKCINNIQRSVKNGSLTTDEKAIIASDYKLKILEELKKGKKRDTFNNIRKIVANSKVRDFTELYRFLYDNLDEFVGKEDLVGVIIAIADSEYRDSFVVDKEITFMSGIAQILNSM